MSSRAPQIAAHALVALTLAIAGLITVLSFVPDSEVRYYRGVEIHQAGGIIVALPAILAAAPGMFVWIETRPTLLWIWTAIALGASLVMYVLLDHVHPGLGQVARWPARVIEVAVWVLMLSTVFGSYLLGFALMASEARRNDQPPALAPLLRSLVICLTVIAGVLLALGFLPGQRVYHDANHCFSSAFASLGNIEHHRTSCASQFTELRGSYPAGGGLRLALYLLVVIAPAWAVYRAPQARLAWAWFGAAIAGSVVAGNLMCWLELDINFLSRTVTLWPVRVVELGVAAIQAVLLLGLPLMIARHQGSRLPTARVVARK